MVDIVDTYTHQNYKTQIIVIFISVSYSGLFKKNPPIKFVSRIHFFDTLSYATFIWIVRVVFFMSIWRVSIFRNFVGIKVGKNNK